MYFLTTGNKVMQLQVASELADLGVQQAAVEGILSATRLESIEDLGKLLGSDNPAVIELQQFFSLASAAGCKDYLEFDPSVVRGLAYYTGIVSSEHGDTAHHPQLLQLWDLLPDILTGTEVCT